MSSDTSTYYLLFFCFIWLLDCYLIQQLKLVIDSINWAFRHTERNIAETGLSLLLEILKNFQVENTIHNLLPLHNILFAYVFFTWFTCRPQDSKINSTKLIFWILNKRSLQFWQTHSTSLVSSFMFWCCSTYFVWYVNIHFYLFSFVCMDTLNY